jgi:hypothetical protein
MSALWTDGKLNSIEMWKIYKRNMGKGKVISLYRPWRPLGLREVKVPTFSDIRLTDGGKVIGPRRRPLFTPWYSFLLEAESSPGP